jgi:ATP-dependent DNA helicase RecQ
VAILPEHVVFDLETNADRPHPSEHEMIQIGAVLVSGNVVVREFETLVRPRRKLPARITELTGLEYGDLEHAPLLGDVLPRFLEWVGDRPLIAHNGFGYDFVVLDAVAAALGLPAPTGPRLDTLELAHLVYPRAGSGVVRDVDGERPPPGRSLDQLAALVGLPARNKHHALEDARITSAVMLGLLEQLNLPVPARRLQRWILGYADHPWAAFIDPVEEPVRLDDVVPESVIPERIAPTGALDIAALLESFKEGGSLMTGVLTPRPQQAEMAQLVATALGTPGSRQMIEAPTGTGKTLAYLVPAIEAARASGRVSVVAPHSRVLQDQILETLEELEPVLQPFSTVVLKGRENYVSLMALQGELDWLADDTGQASVDDPTAMALAILCGWVAKTPSGDWADLRTAAVEGRLDALSLLRWRLRVDARPGPERDRLDELDFYRRALVRFQTSHVAVLNHALLAVSPVLASGGFNLLIDEAHNLEDSVTAASTREASVQQLEMLCDALWDPANRRGLIARLAAATDTGFRDEAIGHAREAVATLRLALRRLTEPLIEHVRDRTGVTREQAARYGVAHRVVRGVDRRHQSYRRVEDAGRSLRDSLRGAATALDDLAVPRRLKGRYRAEALEDEKARLGRMAHNAAELVDAVLWAEPQLRLIDDDLDDDLAQWINIIQVSFDAGRIDGASGDDAGASEAGEWRWALRRAPLSVAGLLGELWDRADSAVLTSATMRAGDDWGYLGGRVGLAGLEPSLIGSPYTDLDRRHLLLLTDYLPAPRGQLMDRFTQAAAAEIPRLCVAADGGAMALMTARSRLEYVRDHARPLLSGAGIHLLAQGDGPSGSLVEQMRAEPSACLLGLKSFWEGVDIAGDALRLLLIEKIPFDPLGDPVVSARKGLLELHGKDLFADYLVPRAAIAFAQGVGRLIRSASDRGVTVVLDNRMRRPLPYVDTMLRGLDGPPEIREIDTAEKAHEAVAAHLGLETDDAWKQRIESIQSVETLSQAALDFGGSDDALLDADEIERRLEIARRWLGFAKWRPGQHDVMSRFMRGEDVVAVLPTGSGKSVTYQIPALLSPGVTLVVSPLIALMRDQVDNLRSRGVSEVAAIHSGVGQAEQEAVLRSAAQGHVKLLYVSPERLWSPIFRAWLQDVDVARVAVDEAHCISLWGHAFRPEYAMIPRAVATAGSRVPVAAVTATATADVLTDVTGLLELQPQNEPVIGSVDRPEIRYYIERCRNRKDRDLRAVQVVEAFRHRNAIVYVPTRNDTVRLAGLLRSFGHRVRPYSGAMELGERQHTEDAFRHGEIDVVVATKAFGLGIDKPDVELIVHLEMPASIEEYAQETGRVARGARDGTGPGTGTAVLLATPRDCRIHDYFVDASAPDISQVRQAWAELEPGLNFIDPDQLRGRADTEDGERDEAHGLALHYLEQVGTVQRCPDFVLRGRIGSVDATEHRLEELRAADPALAGEADRVLRLAVEDEGEYRGTRWAQRLDQRPDEVERVIIELLKLGICSFSAWRFGWVFRRVADNEPDWSRLEKLIEKRRAGVRERAEQARAFARGRQNCRRRQMLRYLGEPDPPDGTADCCGACDACTPELPRPWQDLTINAEDAAEAVREEAEAIVLILIDGTERGRWSRRNLVRTLLGQSGGKFPLPEMLRSHGCHGRLSLLTNQEVQCLIDKLIVRGWAEEHTVEGHGYQTLRLTPEGRRTVRGRYPR